MTSRPRRLVAALGRGSRALDARLLAHQERLPDGRRALKGAGVLQIGLAMLGVLALIIFAVVFAVETRNYRLAQDLVDNGIVVTSEQVDEDVSRGGRRGRNQTRSNLRATVELPDGPRAGETVQVRVEGYDSDLLTSSRQPSGWRPATGRYEPPLDVVLDPADPLIGIARQDLDEILERQRLSDLSYVGLLGSGLLVAAAGGQGVRVLRRRHRAGAG